MTSLTPNQKFLIYRNDSFVTINWEDLFLNKRVLICSMNRHTSTFLPEYIKQISMYRELYKLLGIDEIYLICENVRYTINWIQSFSKGLVVIGDVDNQFTNYLNTQTNRSKKDLQSLSRYWIYQVLINDTHIEKLFQQPVENIKYHLFKDRKFKIEETEETLNTPIVFRNRLKMSKNVFYYNLHPNIELKKYLMGIDNNK